jgi:hypothetical protein
MQASISSLMSIRNQCHRVSKSRFCQTLMHSSQKHGYWHSIFPIVQGGVLLAFAHLRIRSHSQVCLSFIHCRALGYLCCLYWYGVAGSMLLKPGGCFRNVVACDFERFLHRLNTVLDLWRRQAGSLILLCSSCSSSLNMIYSRTVPRHDSRLLDIVYARGEVRSGWLVYVIHYEGTRACTGAVVPAKAMIWDYRPRSWTMPLQKTSHLEIAEETCQMEPAIFGMSRSGGKHGAVIKTMVIHRLRILYSSRTDGITSLNIP